MIFPTIHLNGSASSDLIEQYSNMIWSLRQALSIMANNGPNGRDYYVHPQGPGAFQTAVGEHVDRMKHIEVVIEELEQLRDIISEQQDARRR